MTRGRCRTCGSTYVVVGVDARGEAEITCLSCGDVEHVACGVRAALRELELHSLAQRVTGCAGILRGELWLPAPEDPAGWR